MKRSLIVIKLGGSIITEKSRSKPVFRKKVVERICSEISSAKKKQDFDLILIHGGGSYAHPVAKRYELNKGYLGPKSSVGFALTKKALLDLSLLVLETLLATGLNASIVDSSDIIIASNGKIKTFDTRHIKNLLTKGIIPVLFGNVMTDNLMGFSIISGDQIASYLAKIYKASKVIFVSDVDGIFDRNPKIHKNAKLVQEINDKNYKDVVRNMESHNVNDVTGEMKGKILAIKKSLGGIKVFITNGQNPKNVLKSLLNHKRLGFGTVINFN
jgi:isopentenyl phosphate kinase